MKIFMAFWPCSESIGVADEKLDNISRPFQYRLSRYYGEQESIVFRPTQEEFFYPHALRIPLVAVIDISARPAIYFRRGKEGKFITGSGYSPLRTKSNVTYYLILHFNRERIL